MTNFIYTTIERRRTGTDTYKGTFEATTKPTDEELIDRIDKCNFGGRVNSCKETNEANIYYFDVEIYRD